MTKDFTNRGLCQAKKGLLFLRDCGAAATAACHKCGRPVCPAHQVPSGPGPECPECTAREQSSGAEPSGGRGNVVTRARSRNQWYDTYHYIPLYYGMSSHYYSDRDYRTFDQPDEERRNAAAANDGGTGDGGDFGDLDDYMES